MNKFQRAFPVHILLSGVGSKFHRQIRPRLSLSAGGSLGQMHIDIAMGTQINQRCGRKGPRVAHPPLRTPARACELIQLASTGAASLIITSRELETWRCFSQSIQCLSRAIRRLGERLLPREREAKFVINERISGLWRRWLHGFSCNPTRRYQLAALISHAAMIKETIPPGVENFNSEWEEIYFIPTAYLKMSIFCLFLSY